MANTLYPKAKEGFLTGAVHWGSDTFRVVLIDTGSYTYSSAHDYYNDLSGVVGTESGVLANKTSTDGVADADDVTFTGVTGNTIEAIVIFKDTGNVATDLLIAYIDTGSGLPITPNGGDITVVWSSTASKIFSL
jgi:hypothetical protein